MERVTYSAKSFLTALAIVHKHLTVEQAAKAAQVEVASQIERWGEVEDCTSYHIFNMSDSSSLPVPKQRTM